MPGVVVSYDAASQTAQIQLGVKSNYISESGDRASESIAPLTDVPVIHLGGGGYRTVYPVAKGDTALVVFGSRSITDWLVQGRVVEPQADHRHDLSDGIAIVGLRTQKNLLKSVPTDRMSIGSDTGASIEITPNEVRVGGNTGLEPSLKGDAFVSALNTLLGHISTAIGSAGPGGAGAVTTLAPHLVTFANAAIAAKTTVARVK